MCLFTHGSNKRYWDPLWVVPHTTWGHVKQAGEFLPSRSSQTGNGAISPFVTRGSQPHTSERYSYTKCLKLGRGPLRLSSALCQPLVYTPLELHTDPERTWVLLHSAVPLHVLFLCLEHTSPLPGFLLLILQLPLLWFKGWTTFGWAKSRDQLER